MLSEFKKRDFILLLATIVFLTLATTFVDFRPAKQTTKISFQNVPEMTNILSSDQNTRLTATKDLAERVGVESALEILENSPLPHTGEGHLAVHQIGFHAYKTYGVDSILRCKDYFLYACYHGAIIEAASDHGFPIIREMSNRCKSYYARYFQCVHAAGHAIMAIWNYDLANAVKTCDQLYEQKDEQFEILASCHNGAFMENLFGVHDWDKEKVQKRVWVRDDDPYFPCDAFEEKYQRGCWLNQAARIYQMNNGDLQKTAAVCASVQNEQYKAWCFDNLARQVHPLTGGKIDRVFILCDYLGVAWRDNCLIVNAGSFYSVGGRRTAIALCNQIPFLSRNDCFQLVKSQIVSDIISKKEKKSLCQQINDPFYQKACLDETSN